jgi:hypothetical protein
MVLIFFKKIFIQLVYFAGIRSSTKKARKKILNALMFEFFRTTLDSTHLAKFLGKKILYSFIF